MINTPGVYKIDFPEYLAGVCPEPALSRSTIVNLLNSPAKAWFNHSQLNPDKPKDDRSKFDIGSATHDLLFDGGNRISVAAGFDDWRKNEAKSIRDSARASGTIPLLSKHFDEVSRMVEAVKRQVCQCTDLGITDFAEQGDAELTYIWKHPNGIWCQVRPDWISKDRKLIFDLKTTDASANPESISRHINQMDYPIQSVFYSLGVNAIEKTRPNFVFIFVETSPPYLCSFITIDSMSRDMAIEKITVASELWGKCLKSNQWPGYSPCVYTAESKPWDYEAWEIKKTQIGGLHGIRI